VWRAEIKTRAVQRRANQIRLTACMIHDTIRGVTLHTAVFFLPRAKEEAYHPEVIISHDTLWVTMMDLGYPIHLIDLLAKLQETAR